MNSSFLEGLNRRCLGVRKSWFRAAFGKYPASAASGLYQQKFDDFLPHPVANCGNLFTFAHLPDLRQSNALCQGMVDTQTRRNHGQTRSTSVCGTDTHCHLTLPDGAPIVARLQSPATGDAGLAVGQPVGLRFMPGAAQVLED